MNFDGDLADSEITGHLLVHFSSRDNHHDLLFARRKSLKSLLQLRNVVLDDPALLIALDGSQNGVKHILIAKRFRKEVYSVMLHGVNRHRNVPKAGHHHDWNSDADLDQPGLKLKPFISGSLTSSTMQPGRSEWSAERKSFAVA
jgi:hypothetical protein